MTDQANPPAQGEQDAQAPKYVTEDTLNRAITARLKDFEKKSQSFIGEAFNSFKSELPTILQSVAPQTSSAPPKEGKPAIDLADHPQLKGMLKQIDELKSDLAKERQAKEVERTKARDTSLRSTLMKELADAGISGKRAQHAMAVLVDAGKRVRYAEDSDDLLFADEDGSELDFRTGLTSWLKSEDAKMFLPPRGVQGSGDHKAGKAPSTGNALSKDSIGAALLGVFTDQG